jgi:hypothetical protein
MTYEIKYTTLKSLQYKAGNRLKILDEFNDSIFTATSVATQKVDTDMLLSIAEEKEAYLDYYLDYVYITPLVSNNHPPLRTIIDNLIVAELLEVFYPYIGVDGSLTQQNGLIRDAYLLLRGLTYNLNINIPLGENLYAQSRENMRLIPVKLKGEVFRTDRIDDTNIPEYAGIVTDVKTNTQVTDTSNRFDIEHRYRHQDLWEI